MATVTAVSISSTNPTTTKYQSMKYWTQDNAHLLMRDYIMGACSQFNIASPVMLGMGIMESGGTGSNWMQVTYSAAPSDFVSNFWDVHNKTGESAPTATELKQIDALNAVLSAYWLTKGSRGGKTNWEALGQLASAYNGWGAASANSGITAYGWSTLFLAYGKNYSSISSYTYQGAQYSDKGTGLSSDIVTVYSTTPNPTGAKSIDVPTWTMVPKTLSYFSGGNPNGKQIILFAYTDNDYVSALNILLHFKRKSIKYGGVITYPVVTRDLTLATNNAKNSGLSCVIAVGNNAHLALKGAGLTAYDSFSNLKRPGYIGFTSTGKTAYTDALAAAIAANNGGF
ncbi:hypothetical protein ACQRBP_14975 [Eubacteriales bacterium SGI.150]